jgi:hypothetical protein
MDLNECITQYKLEAARELLTEVLGLVKLGEAQPYEFTELLTAQGVPLEEALEVTRSLTQGESSQSLGIQPFDIPTTDDTSLQELFTSLRSEVLTGFEKLADDPSSVQNGDGFKVYAQAVKIHIQKKGLGLTDDQLDYFAQVYEVLKGLGRLINNSLDLKDSEQFIQEARIVLGNAKKS